MAITFNLVYVFNKEIVKNVVKKELVALAAAVLFCNVQV